MGTWGTAVFSDDFAVDIREQFTDLLAEGVSAPEATARLVQEYGMEADADLDDGPVFWLALAATQWKLGCLEESVKEHALDVIESGADLKRWEDGADPKETRRRAEVLTKLKEQLLSPMPAAKRVRRRYVEETEFEVGDLVRYRLLSGKRVLFLVVGHVKEKGGRYPIVEVLKASANGSGAPVFLQRFLGTRRPNTGGPRRIAIARWSKTDYPADRLERVASLRVVPLLPKLRALFGSSYTLQWWKHLDKHLDHHYGLT